MAAPRFNPRATRQMAMRLIKGTKQINGLIAWAGIDLSSDFKGQVEMANQAIRLIGFEIALRVMQPSMAELFVGDMSIQSIEFVCWRIAANLNNLTADQVLMPWRGMTKEFVFSPVEIVYAKPGWSRGKELRAGTTFTFRVIDGELCPLCFHRWFPPKFLWLLAKELHIHRPLSRHEFDAHRNHVFGMRFVARIVASKFEPGTITFDRFQVGQFKSHNQKLMALRREPCPLEYDWPCYKCTVGANECPEPERACRPRTLLKKFCRLCNEYTYHDEEDCTKCRMRKPTVLR